MPGARHGLRSLRQPTARTGQLDVTVGHFSFLMLDGVVRRAIRTTLHKPQLSPSATNLVDELLEDQVVHLLLLPDKVEQLVEVLGVCGDRHQPRLNQSRHFLECESQLLDRSNDVAAIMSVGIRR